MEKQLLVLAATCVLIAACGKKDMTKAQLEVLERIHRDEAEAAAKAVNKAKEAQEAAEAIEKAGKK